MPGDPKECRAHAVRCKELAEAAPTPDVRQHFTQIADSWIRLAVELETAERFIQAMEAIEANPELAPPYRQTG